MNVINNLVRDYQIKTNKRPFKTIILATGVKCLHYRNGTIETQY